MFARRKHRWQQEDEPLVPHGLIWQATDDEPDQSADPATQSTPKVPSEPIEMPLRTDPRRPNNAPASTPVSRAQELSSAPPVGANPSKLGAISPPIRWPSLRTVSVIRRVEPAPPPIQPSVTHSKPAQKVSVPQQLTPLAQIAAQPKLVQSTAKLPTGPQKLPLEIIELETDDGSHSKKSQPRPALVRVVGSLRQQAGAIYDGSVRSLGHVRHKVQTAYESIHLRARLERARPLGERCVRGLVAGSLSAREICQSWWTSNAPRIARVGSAAGAFSSNAVKSSTARSADFARHVRSLKVRIRIVKSARAQALLQRSKLAWAARTEAVRRDSRLWTSLAMGALSALLTLGLISAVRPYSPGRNSSNKTSRSEQTPIQPASLIAPQTALASARQTAKPHSSITAAQTPRPVKPSPVTMRSKPKPVTHRVSHNDDEDYVAPNSYHYYGSSGKSR
jgi:hypothetical protein